MKTAVEWLADQIQKQVDIFCPGGVLDNNMIEQAKQMEKEQIEKACEFGRAFGYNQAIGYPQPFKTPTTYYNETYKNKEK